MSEKEKIVNQIKEGYEPKTKTKYDELIALNRRVELPAYIFAYTFGIISTLIAGLGMSLSMQVIGGTLPLTVLGLALGIIGFTCTAVNYPIYKKMLEKGKKKYAYEIVELAREISEEK